jgi:hypothetical protein
MIYKEITLNEFTQDETIRGGFSFSGAIELYHYLTDFGSISEPIEFDPIALRCNFTDYGSMEELMRDYSEITSFEDLEQKTIAIKHKEGILIQNF